MSTEITRDLLIDTMQRAYTRRGDVTERARLGAQADAILTLLADHDRQVAEKALRDAADEDFNQEPLYHGPHPFDVLNRRADALTVADAPGAPSDPPRKGNGPCNMVHPHGPHRWGDRDVTNLPWTCPGVAPTLPREERDAIRAEAAALIADEEFASSLHIGGMEQDLARLVEKVPALLDALDAAKKENEREALYERLPERFRFSREVYGDVADDATRVLLALTDGGHADQPSDYLRWVSITAAQALAARPAPTVSTADADVREALLERVAAAVDAVTRLGVAVDAVLTALGFTVADEGRA